MFNKSLHKITRTFDKLNLELTEFIERKDTEVTHHQDQIAVHSDARNNALNERQVATNIRENVQKLIPST